MKFAMVHGHADSQTAFRTVSDRDTFFVRCLTVPSSERETRMNFSLLRITTASAWIILASVIFGAPISAQAPAAKRAVARAYLDQLVRGTGLKAARTARIAADLRRAEVLKGDRREKALSALAATVSELAKDR